ncbi:hypothetical protein BABINDRAFT_158933 [Babjeviella inositovora NRRL Y-12698]|uniref:RNA helicase n=1 Tax=Babjeviella inositovora NRRL Y-12698 TaxID=984486 RepID=A0A1E3QXH0_9ASCO|nr:uncharacterized protein BABINDRAFT_158933 [Babjeviella inositovora NRRL Y-12698]ODQ82311.1 hypothetical protein BABINDRAFT_158933 [Babjeviella inositovora NRRL Y-12698]
MSRNIPVSVEDLLSAAPANLKPTFLSKKKRVQLAQEKLARADEAKSQKRKKLPSEIIYGDDEESIQPTLEIREKRQKRSKWNFSWDEAEDTLTDSLRLSTAPQLVRTTKIDLDVHWSKKPLAQMKDRDWRILKEDFSITSKGGDIAPPLRSWDESKIPASILDIITKKIGYQEPTPIQRATIPVALSSRDIIGIAETGSGKTAAFIIPMLKFILDMPKLTISTINDGPYGLVLAPTRELAQQIERETTKFAQHLGLRVTSIVGGHSFEETVNNVKDGIHIVIATPGRLIDSIERRIIVLSQCFFLVMDEADRMVDMGFEKQVAEVLDMLPPIRGNHFGLTKRQTMMFTATMPPQIEKITRTYLALPGVITIGSLDEAVDSVVQKVEFIATEEKRKKRLVEILLSFQPPIIVFVNYKKLCDYVSKTLNEAGFRTTIMHGSRSQEQREASLAQLRAHQVDVLVATDLAGRGIDIPDVSLVVNFEMSKGIEEYTHRIGRTGRAGKRGTAVTFVGDEDGDVLYELKQMVGKSSVSVVSEELRRHPRAQAKGFEALG